MLYKTTTKLFKGIYQYKIVLICSGAQWFRRSVEDALQHLQSIDLSDKNKGGFSWRTNSIKTQEQLDYSFKLQSALSKMTDLEIRVESPWVSIYTNNLADVNTLANLDQNNVKYISQPSPSSKLAEGVIIMPKMDYDFRVTLSKTNQEHHAFIEWAESNKKIKLTKSCIQALQRSRSWGGTHFYVTGDNNLLMAKMHLAGSISKVERIGKA